MPGGWGYQERAMKNIPQHDVERATIFDWVMGNGDRHNKNYLINDRTSTARLTLIDHGLIMDNDAVPGRVSGVGLRMFQGRKERIQPISQDLVKTWDSNWPAIDKAMQKRGVSNAQIQQAYARKEVLVSNPNVKWGQLGELWKKGTRMGRLGNIQPLTSQPD